MISYEEAQRLSLALLSSLPLETEHLPLLGTVGRILSEDIYTDSAHPPFDNAAVDGIAVQYHREITQWNCTDMISAGNYHSVTIDKNSAVRIMTGAKVPPTADTVIPVEDLEFKDNTFSLLPAAKFKKGMNIRKQGEDAHNGIMAVSKYTSITPFHIGSLAACGISTVTVFKKLSVAILCTGDELVAIDAPVQEDKIRGTNLPVLSTSSTSNFSEVRNALMLPDDRELISKHIRAAIDDDSIDVLLTSGGVSAGEFDYIPVLLEEMGAEIFFWKVAIKPGKPVLAARIPRTKKPLIIFGLPGNPVSSYIINELFVQSNMRKRLKQEQFIIRKAIAQSDISKRDTKRHFKGGVLQYDGHSGTYHVQQLSMQSSGSVISFHQANCLIIFPEDHTEIRKGESVECIQISPV